MRTESQISVKLAGLLPHLDERARRMVAAAEAMALPRGGVSLVHRCCGMSRATLIKGMRELREGATLPVGRQRRPGGGRRRFAEHHPEFAKELDRLVSPTTRGDPESPLRWTCKSTRRLAAELGKQYDSVSHETVAKALRDADCRAIASKFRLGFWSAKAYEHSLFLAGPRWSTASLNHHRVFLNLDAMALRMSAILLRMRASQT